MQERKGAEEKKRNGTGWEGDSAKPRLDGTATKLGLTRRREAAKRRNKESTKAGTINHVHRESSRLAQILTVSTAENKMNVRGARVV
jgi:hypothetical protein